MDKLESVIAECVTDQSDRNWLHNRISRLMEDFADAASSEGWSLNGFLNQKEEE